MKKKVIYLGLLASSTFLFSCENSSSFILEELEVSLTSTVASLEASYNLSLENSLSDFELKGYEQAKGMKDELTPTQEPETKASDDVISYTIAQIDKAQNTEYSKIRRSEPTFYYIGVFKVSTCGGWGEFIYSMDCEDGGWSNIENPQNHPFATIVDRNGNVEFHMCMIDNNYNINGYGLNLSFIPNYLLRGAYILERYHDNEDHSNKNNVEKGPNGATGRGIFGGTVIDGNTLLSWIDPGPYQGGLEIGWPHGVIHDQGDIIISSDDENKSNKNFVRYQDRIESTPFLWNTNFPYKEWSRGFLCWENTAYKVKIFDK